MSGLSQEVTRLAASSKFAGAVRVDRGDEVLVDAAHGLADREYRSANTPDSQLAIASGSKTFTALMVLRLAEQGVLPLHTPARELLGDDLPLIDPAVTVEHLLAHRSGIGDYLDEDAIDDITEFVPPVPVDRLVTTEAFLPWLEGHPMVFTPGERFAYNNGGYVVLALLAERAAGRSFHVLVDDLVFRPAGLAHTSFPRSDGLPEDAAIGYLYEPGGRDDLATNARHLPVRGNGDGGAYTTTADVRAFWRAFRAGAIVSPDSVARMTGVVSEHDGERYGLGLWIGADGSLRMEGGDAGVSFCSVHRPADELTWTVISNWTDGAWPIARLLCDQLA